MTTKAFTHKSEQRFRFKPPTADYVIKSVDPENYVHMSAHRSRMRTQYKELQSTGNCLDPLSMQLLLLLPPRRRFPVALADSSENDVAQQLESHPNNRRNQS